MSPTVGVVQEKNGAAEHVQSDAKNLGMPSFPQRHITITTRGRLVSCYSPISHYPLSMTKADSQRSVSLLHFRVSWASASFALESGRKLTEHTSHQTSKLCGLASSLFSLELTLIQFETPKQPEASIAVTSVQENLLDLVILDVYRGFGTCTSKNGLN